MLNHVQLRDFRPDVVICPHCTQHLMGVRDTQWAADRVSFIYHCAGCGHEIDRPVGADDHPVSRPEAAPPPLEVDQGVTLMDEFPFPFRTSQESGRTLALGDNDRQEVDVAAETGEREDQMPFASMRLLPPTARLDTSSAFSRRASLEERPLTPKQAFDTERNDGDRADIPLPDAAILTRASALLRDVSIFSL